MRWWPPSCRSVNYECRDVVSNFSPTGQLKMETTATSLLKVSRGRGLENATQQMCQNNSTCSSSISILGFSGGRRPRHLDHKGGGTHRTGPQDERGSQEEEQQHGQPAPRLPAGCGERCGRGRHRGDSEKTDRPDQRLWHHNRWAGPSVSDAIISICIKKLFHMTDKELICF